MINTLFILWICGSSLQQQKLARVIFGVFGIVIMILSFAFILGTNLKLLKHKKVWKQKEFSGNLIPEHSGFSFIMYFNIFFTTAKIQ